MEIATALLVFAILLLLLIFGLAFSIFVILIRARAAGALGARPPEETGTGGGTRPPDETKINAMIAESTKPIATKLNKLIELLISKGTISQNEGIKVGE